MIESMVDCRRPAQAILESLQNERLPRGWSSCLQRDGFHLRIDEERGQLEISGSITPHATGSRIHFRSERILKPLDYVLQAAWLAGLGYFFIELKSSVSPLLWIPLLGILLLLPAAVRRGNQRHVLNEFKSLCCGPEIMKRFHDSPTRLAAPDAAGGRKPRIVLDSPLGAPVVLERLRASVHKTWIITFAGQLFFMHLPTTEAAGQVAASSTGSRVLLRFQLTTRNRMMLSIYTAFVILAIAALFVLPDLIDGGACAFNLAALALMLAGPWCTIHWERRQTIKKIRAIIA